MYIYIKENISNASGQFLGDNLNIKSSFDDWEINVSCDLNLKYFIYISDKK